ncbi:hypothetical protein KBZ21_41230, partial [Streptomyces sp. A73]|nr:hypothetical protein [Streptomyces sp. A73]
MLSVSGDELTPQQQWLDERRRPPPGRCRMTDMWTDELTEPAGDEQTWARPRDLEAERTVA